MSEKQDNTTAITVILIIAVVLLILYSHYIFYYYLYIWRALVIPVSFVFKYVPNFINDIIFFWNGVDNKSEYFKAINQVAFHSNNHHFNEQREIYNAFNRFINGTVGVYIYLFLAYTSYTIYKKKTFNKWFSKDKKSTAIDKLILHQSAVWPNVKFLINEHPELEKDLNVGKWRVAESPHVFLRNNDLLINLKKDDSGKLIRVDDSVNDDEKNHIDAGGLYSINVDKTRSVLINQIGRLWEGMDNTNLSVYEKQVLAMAGLKFLRDNNAFFALKKSIASEYTTEKFPIYKFHKKIGLWLLKRKNKKDVEAVLNQLKEDKNFKRIEKKYAYFYTLLMEVITVAKQNGVFAIDFIWLRIMDRHLYMLVNNNGRKAAFSETAGPWSHKMIEDAKGIKQTIPNVESAIVELDRYVEATDYNYVKIEDC